MTKEELGKEAYDYADWFWGASPSERSSWKNNSRLQRKKLMQERKM